MPTTTNYAIPYPCEGDVITPAVFLAYATGVEAAVANVDAVQAAVLHTPFFMATPTAAAAVGVETTALFLAFTTSQASSGVTVNQAAGTVTIITPGLYQVSAQVAANQATLTMTSQRVAVAVNGINIVVRKYRGTNPVTVGALSGGYSSDINLAVGDVVTFRYLWTGTGALTADAQMNVSLALLATP